MVAFFLCSAKNAVTRLPCVSVHNKTVNDPDPIELSSLVSFLLCSIEEMPIDFRVMDECENNGLAAFMYEFYSYNGFYWLGDCTSWFKMRKEV